jgi:hypothetical protein
MPEVCSQIFYVVRKPLCATKREESQRATVKYFPLEFTAKSDIVKVTQTLVSCRCEIID